MNSNKRLSFNAFEIIDDFLYFSSLNCNGLYRMKISDVQAEFIGIFPNEKLDIRHLHGAIKGFEGKLYFAPYVGNCLNIFDINKGEFTTIDLTSYVGDVKGKFYGIHVYHRKVILVPSRVKAIIVYDIDSQKIECHSEWVESVDKFIDNSIPPIKNGSFINDDRLFIPYSLYAALIEISLTDFEVKVTEFENINCGFVDAIFMTENNKVYLLANGKGSIYEVDLYTNEIIEYASNEDFNDVPFPYIKMIDMHNSILLVMYQADCSLLFDKSTHVFKKILFEVVRDSIDIREWNAFFYSAQRLSNDEIIMMGTGDYLFSVIDNSCALKRTFMLEDDMMSHRLMKNQNEAFWEERINMNLEDFIEYMIY